MYWCIKRDGDNGRWFIGSTKWADRTVGTYDQFSPSFLKFPPSKINNIMFYRTDLCSLVDQLLSHHKQGDFTNFFLVLH